MIDKLLVAVDGSDRALRAAELAGELSGRLNAKLTIVTVDDRKPLPAPLQAFEAAESLNRTQVFEALLHAALGSAKRAGAATVETRLLDGPPDRAITAAAADLGADLIVMGSHGFSPVGELVLGSVSHAVARAAAAPCLIAH